MKAEFKRKHFLPLVSCSTEKSAADVDDKTQDGFKWGGFSAGGLVLTISPLCTTGSGSPGLNLVLVVVPIVVALVLFGVFTALHVGECQGVQLGAREVFGEDRRGSQPPPSQADPCSTSSWGPWCWGGSETCFFRSTG